MKTSSENDIYPLIQENNSWLKAYCAKKELNKDKQEDLYQAMLVKIIQEKEKIFDSKTKSSHAYLKTIAINVATDYQKSEIRFKSSLNENYYEDLNNKALTQRNHHQAYHDLRKINQYMRKNFREVDRQIMDLYFMQEGHKEIGIIVGISPSSVTNRISILKKELNEFIKRGLDE
jgi:RNA polymerase sigma factor (sigma-70 family)